MGLHEGIAKARKQIVLRRAVRPNRQARAHVEDDHAQIIDAMHVIGMRVGVGHGIQRANFSIQKLIAQIR